MLIPPELVDQLAEAVACRVVELLDARQQIPSPLVDAATLARILGVSRATVYQHAERLGAIAVGEVGEDRKPRLRFDAEQARTAWMRRPRSEESQGPQTPVASAIRRRRRRTAAQSEAALLPVKGSQS